MGNLSTWHYIAIGMLLLNTGISIGSFVANFFGYRKIVNNHLAHMKETLERIETKVWDNDTRLDEHAERIARVEERTTK